MEKRLLTVNELCDYTGWGATKTRQILKNPNHKFVVRLGRKIFVDKRLFDEYIERCARQKIVIE